MKKILWLDIKVLTLLIFALIIQSCKSRELLKDDSTLKIQMTAEPVTLDFSQSEDGISLKILNFLMDGLTGYDEKGNLVNRIAKKIETSKDGLKIKVVLSDRKWSDGKPLEANEYIYAFKRTLDPNTLSKLSDLMFFIKNAKEYKEGKIKDFSKVGVKALDSKTLEFTLITRVNFFNELFALSIFYPQRENLFTNLNYPKITVGPYFISNYEKKNKIELLVNPYHELYLKLPKKVQFLLVQDENTALNLFEQNKLDLVFRFPNFNLQKLKEKNLVKTFPFFATYFFGFNHESNFWAQKKARLAFAMSIDREAVVKAIDSQDEPSYSWIPSSMPFSNLNIGVKKNLNQAKKLWSELKIKPNSNDLILYIDSGERNKIIAEKVIQDVIQSGGPKFSIKMSDWKTHIGILNSKKANIFRFGFLSVFLDPFAHLFMLESGNPNNYTNWKSKFYDDLLLKIITATKNTEKQKLVDQAQKYILEDEVVIVPIFNYNQSVLVSSKIKDIFINGFGAIDLYSMKF
jgi:oligopeptide transport system substrate-binding protein